MAPRPIARARYALGNQRLLLSGTRALRRGRDAATTSAEVVEMAFSPVAMQLRVGPVQVKREIAQLLDLVRGVAPRRVLEIGTSNGGTLYLFTWASTPDAAILTLDVKEFPPERLRIYRSFRRSGQRLEIYRGDSHLAETRDAVERYFAGEPLDFLFIDGDHSYESVRRDYELYAPLVRPGGLIALHDIVEGDETRVGGVPRFWREIRDELAGATDIVDSWDQGAFGIGVGRAAAPG